jgi:Secretion system C-terminal sorting domain
MFVQNETNMKQLILVFLLFMMNRFSYAQWSLSATTNNAICTESTKQDEPKIASDTKGGAYIVWIDKRNNISGSNDDIFMQRVSKTGINLWANNGIAVCSNTSDQKNHVLVEDGAGGVIITWQDVRNGNRDIFAQHIDSNGTAMWTANGVVVSAKNTEQKDPRIISDGNKGAIIVWEDSISNNTDIYIQHIKSDGTTDWATGGISICSAVGEQKNPRITTDGNGGALIAWQDKRNGSDYDIYAQRISSTGSTVWSQNGVGVCIKVNTQNDPKIKSDNAGGAYIVWQDKRSAIDYDIYTQKIDANGSVAFTANGVAVCTATGNQNAFDMTTENITNGAIICWKDARAATKHMYAQMINNSGNAVWNSNGILVTNNSSWQASANIASVGNNEVIIVWQDSTTNNLDAYAQKINTSGNLLWGLSGVCVSNAAANQITAKNVSDGNGGCIFTWEDTRNTNSDIYAYSLKSNGTPTSISNITDEYEISIFPNPSNGSFYLNGDEEFANNFSIEVLNNVGQTVYQTKLMAGSRNTAIETNLEAGIYFVSVINTDAKKQFITKIIINE